MSGRKLKAISTRPSQPLVEGRVEIAPLTPNAVALSTIQSVSFGTYRRIARKARFYKEVLRCYRAPRRRSQRRLTWERYARLLERFALPTSHITQARTVVAY